MKIQTFSNFILLSWIIFLGVILYSLNNSFEKYEKIKTASEHINILSENIDDFLILNGELVAFSKESSSKKWLNEHKKIEENIKTLIKHKYCKDSAICEKLLKLHNKSLGIFNNYVKYYKSSKNKDELTPYVKIQASNLFALTYEINKISSSMQKRNKELVSNIENSIKNKVATILVFIFVFLTITYIFIKKRVILPLSEISKQLTSNRGLKKISIKKQQSNNEVDIFLNAFNNQVQKRNLWEEQLKLSQEKVKKQKDQLETIFENVKDGIAIVDLNLKFLVFNKAYLELSGYTKEELLQKTCLDLTAPEDIEKTKEALKIVFEQGHISNLKKTCITKENKRVYTNISITLLQEEQKLLLSTKDITALRLLEEQTKMANMGEMIGNIAHQWRQPLSAISISATGMQLQKEMDDLSDEDFKRNCQAINQNVQYLSKTIDDFRNFITKDRAKKTFKIKENLEQFLSLVKGSIKQNDIEVKLEIADDIEITGYDNELIQCYMNLYSNAKDAFRQNAIEPRLLYIIAKQKGENLDIIFRDNAKGIDEKIIDRVFEPYFTTKHKAHGTGLGLHMTYNIIVNGMRGDIKACNVEFQEQNQMFKGVELTITIPQTL